MVPGVSTYPAARGPAGRRAALGRAAAVGAGARGPRGGRAGARAGVLLQEDVHHVAGRGVGVAVVAVPPRARLDTRPRSRKGKKKDFWFFLVEVV